MTDYGPSIKAARLFERTSAKGKTYFMGRMGAMRVTLLKSNETADDGSPIWNLLLSEAPASPARRQSRSGEANRDWQRPSQVAQEQSPTEIATQFSTPNSDELIQF